MGNTLIFHHFITKPEDYFARQDVARTTIRPATVMSFIRLSQRANTPILQGA